MYADFNEESLELSIVIVEKKDSGSKIQTYQFKNEFTKTLEFMMKI